MAPEASEAADGVFGPVRLVREAATRALHGRGWRIRVLSSYSVPVGQGSAELHSLADVVEFVCAQCLEWCEATLVAIRRRYLVCPGCFGAQPRAVAPEPIPAGSGGSEPAGSQSAVSALPVPQAAASSQSAASQRAAAPTSLTGTRRAPWSLHAARTCRRERAG
ncbi:hypothetical protein LY15_004926 [Prauserella flava]|nr:hypothetical protein [Prauserella flava]MCR3737406.1 hypothetical protein [Prauserella salsuginis]